MYSLDYLRCLKLNIFECRQIKAVWNICSNAKFNSVAIISVVNIPVKRNDTLTASLKSNYFDLCTTWCFTTRYLCLYHNHRRLHHDRAAVYYAFYYDLCLGMEFRGIVTLNYACKVIKKTLRLFILSSWGPIELIMVPISSFQF